ncbi:MAG: hypothetical protein SGI92_19285 [Bryobacteraceae bacterium]|nr:hypothetical protein [Bryobacteraceae bacterium]
MTAPRQDTRPTLAELLDLPENVGAQDFVLKLAEAIRSPEATTRQYVVTNQLAACFDEALSLVRGAVAEGKSRAGYLHGSFGTGKSHFMAMLYLLLQGDAHARSHPKLSGVVNKHAGWTQNKNFLLVPYHMIGAETVEDRILGGYVDRVRELHPDVAPPGVYRSDTMVENARSLRLQMGEEAFFRALNASPAKSGWKKFATWDGAKFDNAAAARHDSTEHRDLIGALAGTLLTSARQNAGFVDLDLGLSLISQHAKALAYDGIVLFLDELILWLASRSTDAAWVTREGPKIAKLIESERAERPAPIISFVARQRAIKDLIGQAGLGADQDRVEKAIDWWDARFTTITLEDNNLAAIAQERLLKPKNATAAELIAKEFEKTSSFGATVLDTLLTADGDREQFRQLYPFHPALIKTLVAASTTLQRERTVLNVMAHILVKEQHRMRLGDLVPLGELFIEMRDGHDPFGAALKKQFENARRLWERKLRPVIESEVGIRFDEAHAAPPEKAAQLRAREHVAGTLILSALVPGVEALQSLTGTRVAALNHGSVKSGIRGLEGKQVLAWCRNWGVPEIRISKDADPVISTLLTDVDIDTIVDSAKGVDDYGPRTQKARDLLLSELNVDTGREFPIEHEFAWRGTKRYAEIALMNVREMADSTLRPSGKDWLLVIDLPLDRDGHGPADDLARIRRFRTENGQPVRTLIWLPAFLSDRTQSDLGRLVILDYLLNANVDRLRDHAAHLPAVERAEARKILVQNQESLRDRLRLALRQAYGAAQIEGGVIDETRTLEARDQFQSLQPGLQIVKPVAASLADSMKALVAQALEFEYPSHPKFADLQITRNLVQKALDETMAAVMDQDGRKAIDDRTLRNQIRPLLEGLDVANVGDQFLYPRTTWHDHFERMWIENGRGDMTVGDLRRWTDLPKPMGLLSDVQELIILVYAQQSNRAFRGGMGTPKLGNLPDAWKLVPQELPDEQDWTEACKRAGLLFGVAGSPYRTASNVDKLTNEVKAKATAVAEAVRSLAVRLREQSPGDCRRLKTAGSADALVRAVLASATPVAMVKAIAGATMQTSTDALDRHISTAATVLSAVESVNWPLIKGLESITDEPRASAARNILDDVRRALAEDQYVTDLARVLDGAVKRATALLLERRDPPPPPVIFERTPPPTPNPNPGPRAPRTGQRTVRASQLQSVVDEIRKDAGESEEIALTWEIRST